ncbi:MAG TPA: hypothetical protein VNM69_04380 [Bacillus sp. (in: firmicutes)]|uniref:hypothetical protein n=1 Tax=Bacillus litorisediminis TaxID=2922713 RepID=UPI001FADFA21|nr:hypothetical protein [Bacillus litorisediminis]HWO75142.1 hypothetical protein [Bacillus sp. (in: firmicutes)]
MILKGNLISGEFDEEMNEFSLQEVKHLTIESTIKEKQLQMLYQYLIKHQDDLDGQVIVLNDQIPLRLSQEEIRLFLNDLEMVQSHYH